MSTHVTDAQAADIAQHIFRRRLLDAMKRTQPEFGQLERAAQLDFVDSCITEAARNGLETEQGIASYMLATWFLGPRFEERSPYVPALLRSDFPEVRKVYALNEWVSALLGEPDRPAAAEMVLRNAFHATEAWGRGAAKGAR